MTDEGGAGGALGETKPTVDAEPSDTEAQITPVVGADPSQTPADVTPVVASDPSQTRAEMTPVVVSDPAQAQALGASRSPSTSTYDPAPEREAMRSFISKGVLAVTALAAIAVIFNAALSGGNQQTVVAVFTALVGLSGTVIGFYFGGKDKTG